MRYLARGLFIVLIVILVTSLTPTAAQDNTPPSWSHFGHDGSFDAYAPDEHIIGVETVSQLERQWGLGCDDQVFSVISRAPAVHNGIVYSTGAGRNLWANDALTGELLWQFGENNMAWAPQPSVSADGIVFYMVGQNGIYDLFGVDGTTGIELWQAPIGFDLGFSDTNIITVDDARGLIYVLEFPFMDPGKLYALDLHTGDIVWYKQEATDEVHFKGDYVLANGTTLFAATTVPGDNMGHFDRDHIVSIPADQPQVDIIYDAPDIGATALIYTQALCGDMLLAGYSDTYHQAPQTLVAYHIDSPGIVWQSHYPEGITGTMACNPELNRLYVPSDPFLYALDVTTGIPDWKYAGFSAIYNPSVANGVVYFISATNMYAVNEATGNEIFYYRLGHTGYETSQVAIHDGMLYFSGNGGDCDLFALGLPGGGTSLNSSSAP